MSVKNYLFLLLAFVFATCNKKNHNHPPIKEGMWRGVIQTQGVGIPFGLEFSYNEDKKPVASLINSEEKIPIEDIRIKGDSIQLDMFIFDATIYASIKGNTLTGAWVKNYADDYRIPFYAEYDNPDRFELQSSGPAKNFEGKWEVSFFDGESTEKAIGIFHQENTQLTGTFLTKTGDYRYLEGVVDGDTMKLSLFNGSQAYLFKGWHASDQALEGDFWSGKSRHDLWSAVRNDTFELPDPYTLTYLKEGYETLDFAFPDVSGDTISLSDDLFKGKTVIIQILGSWCPNCMDESRFFSAWYKNSQPSNVEIVGLAFERKPDFGYASEMVRKMKSRLDIPYPVLIAGIPSSAEEALPMLNQIMSFPTSIFLDKDHRVRKIHTGFSGPGTGEYYDRYVEEFNLFMNKLMSE